jgi:outer membrane protein TolC
MKSVHSYILISVSILLTAPQFVQGQNTNPATLSLGKIVREVGEQNPLIKAARANWEAMKQRVPQARAWDDPRTGFDTVAGRFVDIPRNSFTDQRLTLEQTVPVAGKNHLRATAAEAEAIAAFQELRRRELDLTTKARTTFYTLANAHEQLRIVDASLDLLRQLTRTARSKYEAGTKPQSDVLAAQTDASKLEESRYDILREISDAQSQLNVLMNRAPKLPIDPPGHLETPVAHFDLAELQRLALAARPEVTSAARRIDAAKARLEAAQREWIPEPSLRVEGGRYNDASQAISEVNAGISINLPWLNRRKYKAAIDEARRMKESAEYSFEAVRQETLGMVRDALTKVETYHHHLELFRDRIIPLARENASATRLAYETDRTTFLNLIQAQRTQQDAEAMYWTHLTDYLSALAELESIAGTDPLAAAHT